MIAADHARALARDNRWMNERLVEPWLRVPFTPGLAGEPPGWARPLGTDPRLQWRGLPADEEGGAPPMKPHEYRMIETLSREALEAHPVWAPWRPGDRARVLGWGVAPERLDAELERYDYCGLEPLQPVLEPGGLADPADHFVAVRVRLACGTELLGYLLEPQAFGVFVGERDFTFNRGLPDFSRRTAARLAAALGVEEGAVFPLRYRSEVRGPGGERLEGCIEAPW